MKNTASFLSIIFLTAANILCAQGVPAQTAMAAEAPANIGKSLDLYVSPSKEQQQNNAATEAQQKELTDGFKKAFSACMEGKGYTVK